MKLALLLVLLGLAGAMANPRVFLEREAAIDSPHGWEWVGTPCSVMDKVHLTVGLKIRNAEILEETFWAVSTPGNALFHKYLTMEQLSELISPEAEVFTTVLTWILQAGAESYTTPLTRDYISFELPVGKAEELLACRFYTFEHTSGRRAISSYGPYSVPAHIARHVDLVAGVTGFPLIAAEKKAADSTAQADTWTVGPVQLRQVYSVPASLVATNKKTSQAVAEFQGQFYSPTDLKTFWTAEVTYADYPNVTVVGSNSPLKPGVEASLDIEYITSVGAGVPTTFYSYPNFNFWNDLLTYTSAVLSQTNPPYVHSISYGQQSLSQEPSTSYKASLDANFQKFGTLGLTVLISSGDSGCGCQLCTKLSPSYPAGSPYVTAVGATTFQTDVGSTQTAVTAFGSGGGFDWTETPSSYQTGAINTYFNQGQASSFYPKSNTYNAAGRGTPDVSALGWGFRVVNGGENISVGGTSASSPTFAGILSLVNDGLFNQGKPALGFVNPWLYSNPSVLTDITIGNNDHTCCTGFQCSTGWDPVTGLGTPIYDALLASALKQ